MDLQSYLKKYDRDELRLIRWLHQNNVNILKGIAVMNKFARENRDFNNGAELDNAIKDNALLYVEEPIDTIEAYKEIARMRTELDLKAIKQKSYWQRFKEWIQWESSV